MARKMMEMMWKSIYDNKGTKEAKKDMKDLVNTGEKLNKTMEKAFGLGKLGAFSAGISKAIQGIYSLTKKSADYIEQLNVLDVAFDGNTKSIREFTSAISETLNLDEASIIKMAAAFKTLGNSMNYSGELGNRFSRMMTQITLDTASLFNMSLEKSQSMMQSAIQGQGKSLKTNTGVSVLETTVQTTLDVLGIEAYVEDMNDAEKALARTIAISYQLRNAQGDLARTIEAPANRMRVFGEQINQVGRNIGNVFLPMINAILPYLNAVLIVLNKLISSLAKLVGFREDAWDNYTNNAESLGDAFDDLGTSIGGVGAAAGETKKQLMGLRGFDKLNVIKTPTSTGGGGGAGGGGGINQSLLDAFNKIKYKSALEGIETEATRIAKRIMEALGEIDFSNLIAAGKRLWEAFKPFAENVGQGLLWTFDNVLKPLAKWYISDYLPTWLDLLASGFKVLNSAINGFKPIGDWIWKSFLKPLAKWTGGVIINTLKTLSKILDGISKSKFASTILGIGTAALITYKSINKLVTILGATKLGGALKNLIKPTQNLLQYTKLYTKLSGNLSDGIKTGIGRWREEAGIINKVTGEYNGLSGKIQAAKIALEGFAIAGMGLIAADTAFKNMAEDGINLGNVIGGLTGSFATLSGAITAGASIGGHYGAIIGGVVGGVGLLISAFDSFSSGTQPEHVKRMEELRNSYDEFAKTIDDVSTSYQKSRDAITENYEAKLIDLENADTYRETLSQLIDTNGKVKEGYEDEAEVIVKQLNEAYGSQLKLEDGVLKNGEDIVKNKEDIVKVTDKTVEAMKKQLIYEDYIASYREAVETKNKATREYNKIMEESSAELQQLQKDYENNDISSFNYLRRVAELQGKAEEATKKYNGVLEDTSGTINSLDDITKAYATQTSDEFAKTAGNITKTSSTMATENKKTFDTTLKSSMKQLKGNQEEVDKNFKLTKIGLDELKTKFSEFNKETYSPKLTLDTSDATYNFNKWKNSIKGSFNVQLTATRYNADGGIFINNKWRDVAQYDTGGLPPVGQMFVARERGPELVGTIGGHTAVMNNNQIVSSVSAGVYQAVRGAMGNNNNGGVYNIYLDKDHKLGTYTLEQLQGMAKSNGRPITIG